jgi:hypothetical protein
MQVGKYIYAASNMDNQTLEIVFLLEQSCIQNKHKSMYTFTGTF